MFLVSKIVAPLNVLFASARRSMILGIAAILVPLLAPPGSAKAQTFPPYACVQNINNNEYLSSSASQMGPNCLGSNIFAMLRQSNGYYCMQAIDTKKYVTDRASKMADNCDSNN